MAPPKADYGCPPLCSPVAGGATAADKTKWELKSGGIGTEEEEGSVLFVWTAAGLGLKRRNGGFSTFYVHRPLALLCCSGQMEFLPWHPCKPRPLTIEMAAPLQNSSNAIANCQML